MGISQYANESVAEGGSKGSLAIDGLLRFNEINQRLLQLTSLCEILAVEIKVKYRILFPGGFQIING